MTSHRSKQERREEHRLKRARALADVNPRDPRVPPPAGAVMADREQLRHNNTYDELPRFYIDRIVTCRKCGREEVWTAERQKWWYEVAKGHINSTAVLCRRCRAKVGNRSSDG